MRNHGTRIGADYTDYYAGIPLNYCSRNHDDTKGTKKSKHPRDPRNPRHLIAIGRRIHL
jgi:hypothetical protein